MITTAEAETEGESGSVDWRLWCRLCAKDDIQGNISVFFKVLQQSVGGGFSGEVDFTSAIEKYFCVKINPNEGMPEMVCRECFSLVTSLINLADRVSKVQDMFGALYKTSVNSKLFLHTTRLSYGLLDEDRDFLESQPFPEIHYIEAGTKVKQTEEKIFGVEEKILDVAEKIIEVDLEVADTIEQIDHKFKIKEESLLEEKEHKKQEEDPFKDGCSETNDDEKEFVSERIAIDVDEGDGVRSRRSRGNVYSKIPNLVLHYGEQSLECKKEKRTRLIPTQNKVAIKGEHTFACPECPRKFEFSHYLRQHMKFTHSKNEPLQELPCLQCTRTFSIPDDLEKHAKVHLSLELRKDKACPYCEKKFTSESLRTHIKCVHMNERSFICEECGMAVHTNATLKKHMLTHTDYAPFECEICKKCFKNGERLQNHMETHDSHKHICPQCGLQLNSRKTYNQHLLVHSDTKQHKCDYCGRAFKHSKVLKSHLIVHTGLKPYSCDFCDRTFAHASNCRGHKKKIHPEELAAQEAAGLSKAYTHNIPKLEELKAITKSAGNLAPVVPKQAGRGIIIPDDLICVECGIQLKSRATLQQHLLVHSDEKQHKCDFCGRAFKHSKGLKSHLIIHSGLKPYVCNFCGRAFANGPSCRAHKKRIHPQELAAFEAAGGGKIYTYNIPKLEELKALTKSADNMKPVMLKRSGQYPPAKKPKIIKIKNDDLVTSFDNPDSDKNISNDEQSN